MTAVATAADEPLHLIPWPRDVSRREGRLRIDRNAQLVASPDVPAHLIVDLSARWRRLTQHTLSTSDSLAPWQVHIHAMRAEPVLPQLHVDEAYQLRIRDDGIWLIATNPIGACLAAETLLQLVAQFASLGSLPCLSIDDAPRFPWRGFMLDVARHFMPLGALLRCVDGMAALKLNVLHLHLSDDQGFRVQSKRHPLSKAAHGGDFYERDELVHLVRYAGEHGIRVVPEIDIPGHTAALLAAYPSLSARPKEEHKLRRSFGVSRACLDPSAEYTYKFLAEFFAELAEVFPDPYVHMGGDEVHAHAWRDVPHLQTFMAERGFADQRALQGYFSNRVVDILNDLGKTAVGWDEVLHAGLPKSVVVQAWRGSAGRDLSLQAGHPTLVSSGYYLDLFYPNDAHYHYDPTASGETLRGWEKALGERPGFEPVCDALAGFHRWLPQVDGEPSDALVLGGEACLWSELVVDEVLDMRAFSRLPAVAERLWSPATVNDSADFYARLEPLHGYLEDHHQLELDACLRSTVQQQFAIGDAEWPAFKALLDAVEPLKWYARLLGPEVLAQRAATELGAAADSAATDGAAAAERATLSRPYDADTPLTRLADLISPESLPGWQFAQDVARLTSNDTYLTSLPEPERTELQLLAAVWMAVPALFKRADIVPAFAELQPLAAQLARCGQAMANALAGGTPVDIGPSPLPPCADLFLVIERPLRALLRWLAR